MYLGLVMNDFSTQMYIERKNFVLDLAMGRKSPQMYYEGNSWNQISPILVIRYLLNQTNYEKKL